MSGDEKSSRFAHHLGAAAIHVSNDAGAVVGHGVGMKNLRVLLFQDGGFWVAQGLEIDYCAYGDSIEAAQKSFEEGLAETIEQNLLRFGSIVNIFQVAPQEAWQRYFKACLSPDDPGTADRPFYHSQELVRTIVRQPLLSVAREISYIESAPGT